MGDGGSPEAFTTIAEVRDIKGPAMKTDIVDVTNQSSPSGYEEVIPTIRRSGEVDFDVNFVATDATHNGATGLIAILNAKTKKNLKLVHPDSTSTYWTFSGYVIEFAEEDPVAGVMKASVKIKISGPPVLHRP